MMAMSMYGIDRIMEPHMKNRLFLFCLLAVFATSCVNELQDARQIPNVEPVFRATIEHPNAASTKVFADSLRVLWNADDRVSIFNRSTFNREYRFEGQDGANSGTFERVPSDKFVTSNPLNYVYSIYPYNENTSISNDGEITVYLPAEQTYREDSFGLGANTMIAITEDDELMFKNLCGYLAVKLYGDNISVSSITLKGNNGEKLAGNATATMTQNGVPTVGMADDATTEITLFCKTPVQLGATEEESTQFWFVVPPMSLEAGITLSVTDIYGRMFSKATTGRLEIKRNTLKHSSALQVVPAAPGLEAVDLGLPSGLKWAPFNLGASAPEEFGYYYAWGETEPKSDYSWSTYKFARSFSTMITKYHAGDKKTILDPEDDVAHVTLGSKWRIPTVDEWRELIEQCTWTKISRNGINGRLVTGNNGNSIFLPAAGDRYETTLRNANAVGYYSCSTVSAEMHYDHAWRSFFNANPGVFFVERCVGQPVRPVYGKYAVSVEGVSLDKTELELSGGETYKLTVTFLPDNATMKSVSWSSSNTSVARVSSKGVVTGVSVGSAVITVTTIDGQITSDCYVRVTSTPVLEAIDLDLPSGLKWASFNLGAANPEDFGDYYSWGETEPKSDYSTSTYKFGILWEGPLFKYNTQESFGTVDNKTVLDPEDDVAHVKLGEKWRMPTIDEWRELIEQCSWSRSYRNGVGGYLGIARNGKTIFIPAAGSRYDATTFHNNEGFLLYWSSSLYSDYPSCAYFVTISQNMLVDSSSGRSEGLSIRPVCE